MSPTPLASRYVELSKLEALARVLLQEERYEEARETICQGLRTLAADALVWDTLAAMHAQFGPSLPALKKHLNAIGKIAALEDEALVGIGVDRAIARDISSRIELAVQQVLAGTHNPFKKARIRETITELVRRYCGAKAEPTRKQLWGLVLCLGGGVTLGLNFSIGGPLGVASAIQGLDMIRNGLEFEGANLLGDGLAL